MQWKAIGSLPVPRAVWGALMLLVAWPPISLHAQFRDITPPPDQGPSGSASGAEAHSDLAPEPLPPGDGAAPKKPRPKKELLPDIDEENASKTADSATQSQPNQAARDAKLAKDIEEQIQRELVDDTELRPLRFRGVLVGKTTEEELMTQWGEPFKVVAAETTRTLKYRYLPFRQVDVTLTDGIVASVLVHLFDFQEPMHLAKELRMTRIEPVPIPDEHGNVMGLAFPERGVMFGFDIRDPESLVSKILIEPINPEPFLLRAEYDFDRNYARQLRDLETAQSLHPEYARAFWLQARVLSELGRYRDALESIELAIEQEDDNPQYLILRARLLEALGRLGPARRQAERLEEREDVSPEIRAQAQLLIGDVTAHEKPGQFSRAMRHHLRAIEIAAPLANDTRFAIRRQAKEVLIEAHLAVARDVALGHFQRQSEVVPKWLLRAKALVEEYVQRDQGDRALRIRVAGEMLAAAADVRNPDDPGKIVDLLFEEGRRIISNSQDEANKHRVEWMLGTALAEAVRLQRLRGQFDEAVDAANDALALFQQSAPERQSTPSQKYIVGRLYFHLGSLYAVQRQEHDEAIGWFEKAEPMLTLASPSPYLADPRTHGETFISMGVSYWESGDKDKAIQLTEMGTDCLQKAVGANVLAPNVLAIPYGNLASMHQSVGNRSEAEAFAELASSVPSEDRGVRR